MAVKFGQVHLFVHTDERRIITDVTLPTGFKIPFEVRQFKIIDLTTKAIEEASVIGNHFHSRKSRRWEFFVAVGEKEHSLFKARFRDPTGETYEREMKAGDTCLIPPMHSHAFMGLRWGAQLWGFSNLPHNPEYDLPDKLL